MKTINKRAIRQYIRDIKSNLCCPFPMKRALLNTVKQRINEFEPQTIEDLYHEIGSPETIAANIDSVEDIGHLRKKAKKSNSLIAVSAFCLAATLFVSAIATVIVVTDDHYYHTIDLSTTIIQGE